MERCHMRPPMAFEVLESYMHFRMQIGYSTVFFWEYFGPLAVYPLFYYLPQIFYPGLK